MPGNLVCKVISKSARVMDRPERRKRIVRRVWPHRTSLDVSDHWRHDAGGNGFGDL